MLHLHFVAQAQTVAAGPLWPTLVTGAAVGALISAIVSVWGSALESRREHRRWLREKRYDAYTRAFALTKAFDLSSSKTNKVVARLLANDQGSGGDPDARAKSILQDPEFVALYGQQSDLHASAARELAPVVLLGPAAVSTAVLEMQEAYERSDDEAAGRAEVAFRDAARDALKID